MKSVRVQRDAGPAGGFGKVVGRDSCRAHFKVPEGRQRTLGGWGDGAWSLGACAPSELQYGLDRSLSPPAFRFLRRSWALLFCLLATLSVTGSHAAEPKPGDVVTNSVGMKLAWIPSGSFTMGSPKSEPFRITNETQTTETIAKGFRMGVTEVTQKQWREVMGTDPSFFKGDDLPVEHVTWHDAAEFCRKLSEREKRRYRLPTGVEWEYACRAGTATAYNTGNGEASLRKAGWFNKNSANKTHPVGLKQANAWGLHDMHGNVSEWGAQRPEKELYRTESKLVNLEIKDGRDHRGGSWGLTAGDCRSASRHRNNGNYRYFDLGLRVVREEE